MRILPLLRIFIGMKKYPIGIQDFRELRKRGYLYVDKTKEIYDLIETGKYYFLSRPRRFVKSLLISTLKYLFQGERELFEGLWIDERYDFEPHPVLHFQIGFHSRYSSLHLRNIDTANSRQ